MSSNLTPSATPYVKTYSRLTYYCAPAPQHLTRRSFGGDNNDSHLHFERIVVKLVNKVLTTLAVLACSAQTANAGESPFGWIYLTEIHPAGTKEFEQQIFIQRGQTQGDYTNTLLRTELEFGVTPKYQTSFYLNTHFIDAFRNGIDGTTGGPDTDIPEGFDPTSRYKMHRVESVSWENIYQVMNPLVDPIGLALYIEPSWGPRNKELEFRLLLQKNFLDDRLILAANIETAFERKNRGNEVEKSTEFNLQTGVSYRFMNNWSAGVELRNHHEYSRHGYNDHQHSAWFFGPNIHYATKGWWITAAWRTQLPWAKGFTDEQRSVISEHRIYGDEHVRNEFALKLGIPF